MLRDKLTSYWPVILLCAGGVAWPLQAFWSDLPSILEGYGRAPYPVRIELPPVTHSVLYNLRDEIPPETITDEEVAEPTQQEQLAAATVAVAGGLPAAQAGSETAAAPGRLLAVNFDLANPASADNAVVDARKNVRVDGIEAGSAAIRVTSGSALFIARDDFRNLLTSSGHRDLAARVTGGSAQFVSFDEIRRLGFGVRYDPVTDRILVSS